MIAAVGDIACRGTSSSFQSGIGTTNFCQQRWTSDLICRASAGSCLSPYDKVLVLGDIQYDCADYEEFVGDTNEFFDSRPLNASWAYAPSGPANSWKRVEDATAPDGSMLLALVAGNHEYMEAGDSGAGACALSSDLGENTRGACYFRYFNGGTGTGDENDECEPNLEATEPANLDGKTDTVEGVEQPAGYYDFDLGSWRMIVLNSSDGCDEGPSCADQTTWLEEDAFDNPPSCVLASWHHPKFDSDDGDDSNAHYADWWEVLVGNGTDIVLNGHRHFCERFAKMDEFGDADENGAREFIVGSGGKSHEAPSGYPDETDDPRPNSEARNPEVDDLSNATNGILELTLHSGSYEWQFIPSSSGGTPTNGDYTDQSSSSVPCNS
jgi:hypothetical protein